MAVLVFLVCFCGESLGLAAPYVLEATWLLVGYRVSRGLSPVYQVVLLLLLAQLGRQIGAHLSFQASQFGWRPLARLVLRTRLRPLYRRSSDTIDRIQVSSPFLVAVGRLVGLRIPLTLLLGSQRRFRVLAGGILLSGLAFDGTYLLLGAIVGGRMANATYLLPCFLLGVGATYGLALACRAVGRRLIEARSRPAQPVADP